jgi:predicted DNA-binding transcriptional regulator YafY
MGQAERLRRIERLLGSGRAHTTEALARRLEVSRSTIKRDMTYLQDRLDVPLAWRADRGGWHLPHGSPEREAPAGLGLDSDEVHALMTMHQLLMGLDAGDLLAPHMAPLMRRLRNILGRNSPSDADVARRIRIMTVASRRVRLPHFQTLAQALLQRQRLRIRYRGRSAAELSEREVSPQRLVHYKDNWYLDAWCHLRAALRSFSVDAVEHAAMLPAPAMDVDENSLDDALGAGYGIFAGPAKYRALLRFSADRARWVASERWHPLQVGRFDASGRWLLDLPYADPRELVMDILRHVPEVEVLAPDELRLEVLQRLRQGAERLTLDE